MESRWHSRGYLPHFEGGQTPQSVTFRLHDSLPQALLERWRTELEREPRGDVLFRKRIDEQLDRGYGSARLREPRVAALVQDALLYFDGERYRLFAWVVMPNHVHLLLAPREGFTLSRIMHSLKSYTAKEAHRLAGGRGRFWMEEYFDRYIRDAEHFSHAVAYIEHNPVKAKLCRAPQDWPYSSARLRHAPGSAGILPA
jgi:REP element-mobilizing transposase RayT